MHRWLQSPTKNREYQEQEWNGKIVFRPIAYESKVLSDTEMQYGAAKADMFAVVTFVKKYRAYLGSEPTTGHSLASKRTQWTKVTSGDV